MIYHLYVESKNNGTNEPTYKLGIVTDVENKHDYRGGKSWGRDKLEDWDWYVHTTIYKIYMNLLYGTGNSIQYSGMTYMGTESLN